MAKEVNYNSLKEQLNQKQYSSSPKKEIKKISNYKLIKEILNKNSSKGETPSIKADSIVYALGTPKSIYDDALYILSKDKKEKKVRGTSNWGEGKKERKRIKQRVNNYTKKDIDEAIINDLHELDSKGIQSSAGRERSMYYKGKMMTKYSDIDPRSSEFKESFDNIQKLEIILSNKRFLKKHGITSDDIKKYKETFKKRVGRVLNNAVEFAKNKETQNITAKMLDFAKKEGLINYKKSGLEKSLVVLSISSILGGLLLGFNGMTGNVISNGNVNSFSLGGIVLFILGIVGAFFTLRK